MEPSTLLPANPHPPPLPARTLAEFLARYLAGELTPRRRAAFEALLDGCPACVAYLNDLPAIVRLVAAARQGAGAGLPSEVPAELSSAVAAALGGQA